MDTQGQIKERIKAAERLGVSDDDEYHLMNAPAMQSDGRYIENCIAQRYVAKVTGERRGD